MRDSLQDKNPLETRVSEFIRTHCPIPEKSRLLVAVSGGPDSVCLLHILTRLREEMGIELRAAHLDHQLRGAESEADAAYVAGLTKKLDIPVTIAKRDVNAYRAEHRLSPEEAAREVRYQFLSETAQAIGAGLIAVGHTEDDHIETVLMHLIRGSGTRGLRGLRPVTIWHHPGGELAVIRPLLTTTRRGTQEYCREQQLSPCLDATNLSPSPLRNRIRLNLLPQLKSYNPRVVDALLRTARIAADDATYIEESGERAWQVVASQQADTITLDKKFLLCLPQAIKRQVLRVSLSKLNNGLKDIEARHIEDMIDALAKPTGSSLNLPGGLIFTVDYEGYQIGREPAALSPYPPLNGEFRLDIPGTTHFPGWRVEATVSEDREIPQAPDDFTASFDFATTGNELTVRSRRPGDRLIPLGMTETKRLNRLMMDAKVPRPWRVRIPIVVSEKAVIWAVGLRLDERFKITGKTEQVLSLRFIRD